MSDLPHHNRFWMVCRAPKGPQSKTEPRQRYASFFDAMQAARKLAQDHDAQFLVLETVDTAHPENPAQESLL